MQQPPPEEGEQIIRTAASNPEQHMATRLLQANLRELQWRKLRIDGIQYAYNANMTPKPYWHTLAKKLMLLGITNPERFIHTQYMYSIMTALSLSDAPISNSFEHPTAIDRFQQYNARAEFYLTQELKSAILTFECTINEVSVSFPEKTDKELWKYVLINRMYELPPLFRYSVGVSEAIQEVIQIFHNEALQQLLSDPIGYVATWKGVIPEALKQEASGILQAQL